jgi:hypothetical protein
LRPIQEDEVMLSLSPKWAEFFRSSPETGMDYTIVSVILKDGQRLDRVYVVGGTVTQVDGSSVIPFSEDEIAEFIVTHDKTNRQISD